MKKKFKKIGVRIRKLRKEMGWTQKKVASRVGCSHEMISGLERGLYKPANPMLISLGNIFCVPITDIDPDTDIYLKELEYDNKYRCKEKGDK
jgi:transcriptional regulator with XRE-family HTH domain